MSDTLTRSYAFELDRADSDGDGLTLEGYAAVFDQETVIDSWEGKFVEKIARGAFRKSLRERSPVVQFDHGRHPLVGSLPLGSIDVLREDNHGLYVRARLHDNWLVEPVRDAIKSGSIDGMSFRFSVVKEHVQDPTKPKELPVRTIQEVKLYELGPVVFPAYEGTSVGVRTQEVLGALGDPEVRVELARALMAGVEIPSTSGEARGSAADPASNEAADPDEPREHSPDPTVLRARDRALKLAGVI